MPHRYNTDRVIDGTLPDNILTQPPFYAPNDPCTPKYPNSCGVRDRVTHQVVNCDFLCQGGSCVSYSQCTDCRVCGCEHPYYQTCQPDGSCSNDGCLYKVDARTDAEEPSWIVAGIGQCAFVYGDSWAYCNNDANLVENCTACDPTCVHGGLNGNGPSCINDVCQNPVCTDGTPYNQCSATNPLFCMNGTLRDVCSVCGCSGDSVCNTTTNLCYTNPVTSGSIYVTGTLGAGVYIDLDGDRTRVTPVMINNLAPGSHLVTVWKDGYYDYESTITVNPGQTTNVDAILTMMPRSIYVESTPAGADVYIDGTLRGVTPLLLHDIIPGSHTIKVSKSGYETYEQTLTVNLHTVDDRDVIRVNAILAGYCGNGILEPTLGEECDDGNTVDTDGCTNTCMKITYLTSCATIANPGRYKLLNDVTATTSPCFNIISNDTSFDGNGHNVEGNSKKCIVSSKTKNINISNVNLFRCSSGIELSSVNYSLISDVTATSSTNYGMLVSTCWNTVLKSNIINYAGNNGLRLFGGSGNTLSSNSICNSILYCFSNALSSNNNIFSGLNQCGDSSQTACPECGDGIQQGINEECDDGNRVSGDGCSSTCFNEKGSMYIWTGVPEGETINSQVFVDGVYNGSLGDSIDWPYIQIYALPGYHTIKVVIEGYETYINESVLVVTRQATEVEVKLIPKINRLAAYYTLDGNTDDTSGNGLNGVNNGAVLSQYAKSGQAYYFNGSTFIQAGSPTSLSDDITISFWVNPSSLSQNEAGMVYNGDNDGVGYGVMLKNDKLYVLYGALLWANGGYTIPKTNRWYNIVMVRDNAVLKLYVDGVRTSLNDLDGAIAPRVPTNSFFIGRSPISWEGNPRFFNGIIDEVKVYEGAMSDSEILAQYQSVDPNAGLIPGKCGSTVNICLVGDLQDINDDMINSNYLWNCIGDGGMDYCNISMMGSINAKTTPSGASLYIDGILNGVTPIIVKNVTKGSHGIRLFKSGYLSYNSIVTVNSGQETTINENLTVVPGSINAKSTPSGARVYLNGTLKGVTNTTITDVAPGSYLVKMSKQDYKSYEKNITITSGQVTIVSSILTILPGLINATSNPTGATVYLDNVYKGTTPKNITGISPGNHTLKFTKTDYFNYTTSVDVFAGTAKNLDVTLSYSLGGIHVTSTFSGANISVDGVYKGTTPKNITGLTQGNHTVKFAKYGYYGSTMVIGVIASNNQSVLGTLIAMPNGTIEAISDPKGASIYIDGYPKSSTNRNVTGIPVGSRTVKLVKTGYQNYTSVVDVYQNQRTTVNVNLIPV